VFPTTIWTSIERAGASDPAALEAFAREYRAPVLAAIQKRGFAGGDAEDLCQEVFLRILSGDVLARADATKGRFRSLVLAVTMHVIQHRLAKRKEIVTDDLEPLDRDPDFDRAWVLHLAERAMRRLREASSPYFDVLQGHLAGDAQDRNKLWIARNKLQSLIRDEVARTCSSPGEIEGELEYLRRYLRPNSEIE
jgi:hypothetical protein